ncbi:hypothetical protein BC830DRAFT_1227423 [Chytriomyces sp. MP71]|nr:hypothetical protein BC830DRAFT_1227423 [Chytriomyces sp. MP71]
MSAQQPLQRVAYSTLLKSAWANTTTRDKHNRILVLQGLVSSAVVVTAVGVYSYESLWHVKNARNSSLLELYEVSDKKQVKQEEKKSLFLFW